MNSEEIPKKPYHNKRQYNYNPNYHNINKNPNQMSHDNDNRKKKFQMNQDSENPKEKKKPKKIKRHNDSDKGGNSNYQSNYNNYRGGNKYYQNYNDHYNSQQSQGNQTDPVNRNEPQFNQSSQPISILGHLQNKESTGNFKGKVGENPMKNFQAFTLRDSKHNTQEDWHNQSKNDETDPNDQSLDFPRGLNQAKQIDDSKDGDEKSLTESNRASDLGNPGNSEAQETWSFSYGKKNKKMKKNSNSIDSQTKPKKYSPKRSKKDGKSYNPNQSMMSKPSHIGQSPRYPMMDFQQMNYNNMNSMMIRKQNMNNFNNQHFMGNMGPMVMPNQGMMMNQGQMGMGQYKDSKGKLVPPEGFMPPQYNNFTNSPMTHNQSPNANFSNEAMFNYMNQSQMQGFGKFRPNFPFNQQMRVPNKPQMQGIQVNPTIENKGNSPYISNMGGNSMQNIQKGFQQVRPRMNSPGGMNNPMFNYNTNSYFMGNNYPTNYPIPGNQMQVNPMHVKQMPNNQFVSNYESYGKQMNQSFMPDNSSNLQTNTTMRFDNPLTPPMSMDSRPSMTSDKRMNPSPAPRQFTMSTSSPMYTGMRPTSVELGDRQFNLEYMLNKEKLAGGKDFLLFKYDPNEVEEDNNDGAEANEEEHKSRSSKTNTESISKEKDSFNDTCIPATMRLHLKLADDSVVLTVGDDPKENAKVIEEALERYGMPKELLSYVEGQIATGWDEVRKVYQAIKGKALGGEIQSLLKQDEIDLNGRNYSDMDSVNDGQEIDLDEGGLHRTF